MMFKTRDDYVYECSGHICAFLAGMQNKVLVEYVRDVKTRQKVGVVIAYQIGHDVNIGWSLCRIKKEKHGFNKSVGLSIAVKNSFPIDDIVGHATLSNINNIDGIVEKMKNRARRYYKTAVVS